MLHNIVLHNEEVWSNTISSSSEASGVNHIIFNEGAARVENMLLHCTYELCNYISYQVEMVRAWSTDQFTGSITTVARHAGVSILLQLLSCGVLVTRFLHKQWHVTNHMSPGSVRVGYVPKNVKIISFCRITSPFCYYIHSLLWK